MHHLINDKDEMVVEFVDQLFQDANRNHISDIHLEPYEAYYRIRFRRDGLLYEVSTIPCQLAMRVIARIKIMANLNIAERRLPQDGRIQYHRANYIDLRVNVCPTVLGEKIVLRILDMQQISLDLHQLGLIEEQKALLLHKLSLPQGLILVTGPTGSGKTITLYSTLHYLNRIEKNIFSVEDPVEIKLPGINQVNVNPKIGLDFSTVLRTFLRQDPNIIMIGEIRDKETAGIALQAAETGHLVLSTLHTNNTLETLARLESMDLNHHHLMNTLSLIMAQRLVRKLCAHCKEPEQNSHLPFDSYKAIGCKHCHQGYAGRIGVFELLPITETVVQAWTNKKTTMDIMPLLKQENWMPIWEAGLEKVRLGLTSVAELRRVVT